MTHMTAEEYIRQCLRRDFQDLSVIEDRFTARQEELLADSDPTDYQELLNNQVYPFLAVLKALLDTGYGEKEATDYVKRIVSEAPER